MITQDPIRQTNNLRRLHAKEQVAAAINNLATARDELDQLGETDRSSIVHKMMLDLGTIMQSV